VFRIRDGNAANVRGPRRLSSQEDGIRTRSLERATNRGIEGVAAGMRNGREVEGLDAGRCGPP
jgi:hypothetical protein